MTKGEVTECLMRHASHVAWSTISCSHPSAGRWRREPFGNCGYCYPCIIRQAGFHRFGNDETTYSVDPFSDIKFYAVQHSADLGHPLSCSVLARPRSPRRHPCDGADRKPLIPKSSTTCTTGESANWPICSKPVQPRKSRKNLGFDDALRPRVASSRRHALPSSRERWLPLRGAWRSPSRRNERSDSVAHIAQSPR